LIKIEVNKEKFKFRYLPEYAAYLAANRLTEFVTVGIRFCREAELPLLKPLSKLSEEELVAISIDSNKHMLEALADGTISDLILANARKWVSNTIGFVDKDDISAEDFTLGFFLRRKIFAYFLDGYTKNVVLQKLIIAELDVYTTQEELISYNLYLKMQQEKLIQINADLSFHKGLLLEAQELGQIGSFLIDFKDNSKSVYTPEYKRIFEMDDRTTFDKFIGFVHPADRPLLMSSIESAYTKGGHYEVEYRYQKSAEKRIWSKGFIIAEEGKPVFIRGIVKEMRMA
jgi:hypothetical protein